MSRLIKEKSDNLVAATFEDEAHSKIAVDTLVKEGLISRDKVDLVTPNDNGTDRKLEPESRAIKKTLWFSHINMGAFGFVFGFIASLLLIMFGPTATQASPLFTVIAMTLVCTLASLMLAGALSLRPDHDPVAYNVKHAASAGRWSVVAHANNRQQAKEITQALKPTAKIVTSSW
ncbi:hypothetical protein [Halioxenophilus aromaticivorans]|uniref:Uncharacterized protein n=1 Tax=Halioxenophilus aromaticivorans TaxID=1306992 RepID=A0AAV3UA94_9ALTE